MPTSGGAWPTVEQRLLLRAALLDGDDALRAWREWRRAVDVAALDPGSRRLLTLLASNLRRHGATDPWLAELRALHRSVWAQNRMLFRALAGVLEGLEGAGLETMVLKGAALIALYYRDPGLRPMSDVDVLVPTRAAPMAMSLLRGLGWQAAAPAPEQCVAVSHGHQFHGAGGTAVDLHWHVLWECCAPDADDDFWAAAVRTTVDGVATRALGPTDQLLHAVVHGVRWNPVPPLRWVADALVILRGADIAWGRLVAQARARRLTLPVADALAFLRAELDVPVPEDSLAALRALPVSRLERLEHAARTRPWGRWGALPLLACHHLRLSGHRGLGRALLGFPRYLQRYYGLARLSDLPSAVGARWRRKA